MLARNVHTTNRGALRAAEKVADGVDPGLQFFCANCRGPRIGLFALFQAAYQLKTKVAAGRGFSSNW